MEGQNITQICNKVLRITSKHSPEMPRYNINILWMLDGYDSFVLFHSMMVYQQSYTVWPYNISQIHQLIKPKFIPRKSV